MTRWALRQLQKQRKEERKAQIMGMVWAGLFGLMVGGYSSSQDNDN